MTQFQGVALDAHAVGTIRQPSTIDAASIIDHIVKALRGLEQCASGGRTPNAMIVSFLGALDRLLTSEERAYVAMAFACQKDARDELTVHLERQSGLSRGAVIAGIKQHLVDQAQAPNRGTPQVRRVAEYMMNLRNSVIAKAARVH